ncbi:MAG: hypothetical protein EBU66_04280 [Bacteroidetes bacterium]|nr:hypothetical protein [bacterium]NBP63885.1 hypothetical protein [Bacteroidota bacterium]
MAYVTTEVEVGLDEFDDHEILEEALDILEGWIKMSQIRVSDEILLAKFRRLFSSLSFDEYKPSTATTIRSMEQLKEWQEKENAQ